MGSGFFHPEGIDIIPGLQNCRRAYDYPKGFRAFDIPDLPFIRTVIGIVDDGGVPASRFETEAFVGSPFFEQEEDQFVFDLQSVTRPEPGRAR